MSYGRSFSLFLVSLVLVSVIRAEQPLADSTIVVYNKTIPESFDLAKFYAKQRSIARDHMIGLNCSAEEEISRTEYNDTIANPLREAFKEHGWWTAEGTNVIASSIHFVAIIKGVPLKVRSTPDPGDEQGPPPIGNRNEASVDSELAMLAAYSSHISGSAQNPYFQNYRAIGDVENAILLLVCRLDAPSAATVRQMIVDAISAEKNGLWGRAYVDGAHNSGNVGLVVGDLWLAEITKQLHKVGIPVIYDESPEIFPETYPMTDCALYYGWYTANMAGPFTQPDFRFVRGAVAVHIHSFSAHTLRDPNADWVGPLVSKGAAASLGNVYEPYLQLTAQLDIFNDRLLHGFTFGESAYMSMRVLSWMSVMVGDPLYRPYASWLQLDEQRDSPKGASDWKMYHEFAVKNAADSVPAFRASARQAGMRAHNGPMMEDLGLLEARDGRLAAATNNFQLARAYYTKRDDIVRVVLEESDAWIKLKKPKRALELIRTILRTAPDSPAAPLLRNLEREASGRPPISPAPNKP